ncbi:MAG: SlyX family protein [Pedosphaera sp.]|nr:SlyX family protein [Pedosphaera sp.]
MSEDSLPERLMAVEASLAHLERHFDDLNSVVIDQARLLVRLQKRVDELGQAFDVRETERSPHQEKPPHYAP